MAWSDIGFFHGARRASVLLVDDDRSLSDTLSAGLRSRGYDAHFGTSGEAAVEQLLAGAPVDVVVTDLTMGGMDGLAVCGWVAQNRADVPVILLTAFGNFERAVAALRVGAFDFITKPVKIDVLAMAVARAASHRALHGEVKVLTLEELERRHVERVLSAVGGNKAAAARLLGIERKTLYRKFEQWQRVDGSSSRKTKPG